MKKKESIKDKLKSKFLWGNIIAMVVVVILIILGVKHYLNVYTHHGEIITVPSLKEMSLRDAESTLSHIGLLMSVSDTGYVKTLPAGCVLDQQPDAGAEVKTGRMVYVVVNSGHSPTIALPDIIDNSSLREALAKLKAMGFKVGEPEYVTGERDWVYGIKVNGHQRATGDRVSVDDMVIVQTGDGYGEESDSLDYVEIGDMELMYYYDEQSDDGEVTLDDNMELWQ